MKVCVIGGAGKMGSWFAKYFKNLGHEVLILDVDEKRSMEISSELGVKMVRSIKDVAADVYLICVPTSVVAGVFSEIKKEAKKTEVIVVEISSVKSPILNSLVESQKHGFHVLSIHPMFGPNVSDPSKSPTVLVSLNRDGGELDLARSLMPNFKFFTMSVEEHDQLTSFLLSLTHFINLAFCLSVCDEDIGRLKEMAGASFNSQMNTLRHVLDGGNEAIADTLVFNLKSVRVIEKFLEVSRSLLTMIRKKDVGELKEAISRCRSALSSFDS